MNFNTLFPDERETGETRLRQCQMVMLRMLKIFDHLCDKHQISYFLVAGSLLGAVRHKGFIPWDDDVDIGMTRDNYDKFVQKAVPELPPDIFFQNRETDPPYPAYHLVEAKLRDKYSSCIRNEEDIIKHKIYWHDGIQLDLCVFDRSFLPHNYFIWALNRSIRLLGKNNSQKKRAAVLKLISKYVPFPLVYASNFISDRKQIRMGTNYFKKIEISKLIKTKFEDMEVFIPCGWHSYLSRRWGDYMQLPAAKKQKAHHGVELPDPFSPCNHSEILLWKNRNE